MTADQQPTDDGIVGALWGLYYSIWYGDAEDMLRLPEAVLRAYTDVQQHHREAVRRGIEALS